MMEMPSLLFYLHCIVVLVAALVGLTTSRGARTSVACFLLSMSSLVGILILLDAHVIAIALLLFCGGLGFVAFFVIGLADHSAERASPPESWQWLIVMLGLACAVAIGSLLLEILPSSENAVEHAVPPAAQSSFEVVGLAVLIDQGIALVGVGLLLLASLIGAGFLARRGVD
jgi:NADH:ubiquinone oxidoreductase subunit 6 (subunit J)